MEINLLIIILDIFGSIFIGYYQAKKITKDIKTAAKMGAIAPVIVFISAIFYSAITSSPEFFNILIIQLYNFLGGYIAGVISIAITAMITVTLKGFFKNRN